MPLVVFMYRVFTRIPGESYCDVGCCAWEIHVVHKLCLLVFTLTGVHALLWQFCLWRDLLPASSLYGPINSTFSQKLKGTLSVLDLPVSILCKVQWVLFALCLKTDVQYCLFMVYYVLELFSVLYMFCLFWCMGVCVCVCMCVWSNEFGALKAHLFCKMFV